MVAILYIGLALNSCPHITQVRRLEISCWGHEIMCWPGRVQTNKMKVAWWVEISKILSYPSHAVMNTKTKT